MDVIKNSKTFLESIFSDILKRPVTLSRTDNAKTIEGWDSLNNIKIILSIEAELKVKINTDLVFDFKEVGELIDYIDSIKEEKNK